jgi:hypothetical protein
MKILSEESKAALVFGINPMRKSKEKLSKKVRIDMKRLKFYTYRRIAFGDKTKVINTNPFGLGY